MNWYKHPKVRKETLGPDGFLILKGETVWFNKREKDLRVSIFKTIHKDTQFTRICDITREAPWEFNFSSDGITINSKFYVSQSGAMRKAENFMRKVKSMDDYQEMSRKAREKRKVR